MSSNNIKKTESLKTRIFNSKLVLIITVIIIAIILPLIFIFYFNNISPKKQDESIKKTIAVSFSPIVNLIQNITVDRANLIDITANTDPHDFEPTTEDLTKIYSSNLFIYHGQNLDNWVDKILPELKNKNIPVLKLTSKLEMQYINKDNLNNMVILNEDSLDHSQEENQEIIIDPHFWLDPVIMKNASKIIKEEIQKIDTQNNDFYEQKYTEISLKLENLDLQYQNKLAVCKTRELIVSHLAFNYLAKRYNLNFISIFGLEYEEDFSVNQLQKIADIIVLKGTKYILVEPNFDNKLTQQSATDLNIRLLPFYSLENSNDSNYIDLMQKNLETLVTVLDCN